MGVTYKSPQWHQFLLGLVTVREKEQVSHFNYFEVLDIFWMCETGVVWHPETTIRWAVTLKLRLNN